MFVWMAMERNAEDKILRKMEYNEQYSTNKLEKLNPTA